MREWKYFCDISLRQNYRFFVRRRNFEEMNNNYNILINFNQIFML